MGGSTGRGSQLNIVIRRSLIGVGGGGGVEAIISRAATPIPANNSYGNSSNSNNSSDTKIDNDTNSNPSSPLPASSNNNPTTNVTPLHGLKTMAMYEMSAPPPPGLLRLERDAWSMVK